MSVQETQNYHFVQIMCLMNQLHRLAVHGPKGDLPPGFSISQLAAVGFLFYQHGHDVYQRDLEGFFKLRRSTLSSLLNALEKKDILRRVSVPHDARLKKLELTQKGERLGTQVQAQFLYLNDLLIQGLTPKEQKIFAQILDKISCSLNAKA